MTAQRTDPRTLPEFADLPKFLFADGGGDVYARRHFVIHCHYPRFIMEFKKGRGTPRWIDQPIFDPDLGEPANQCARLLRQAGEFFGTELDAR
jgi:hypothetical protein